MASAGVDFGVEADALTATAQRVSEYAGEVVAGWLDDAKPYSDGTDVRRVAAVHEFGTSDVPARMPLRSYFDSRGKDELARATAEGLGQTVDGKQAEQELEQVGELAAEGIGAGIESGLQPALAPSTLANPDRDSRGIPLLDTGHLLSQVDSEVR